MKKSFKVAEIQLHYNRPTLLPDAPRITSSLSAYQVFIDNWNMDTIQLQEEFKVLLLSRSNDVLGILSLSKGGIAGTIVDARLIFAAALKAAACSIILGHNHPSGNLRPSNNDLEITKKIKAGGMLLDIMVCDHLIISDAGYYSFADEGDL
jgi:DNA repair protein RadC